MDAKNDSDLNTTDEALLAITLPVELRNGNTGRGKAWYATNSERKRLEALIRRLGLVRRPFDSQVRIRLWRLLGPRQSFWDADSGQRGNTKELIDALTACGWFTDDSRQWIQHVDVLQSGEFRKTKFAKCTHVEVLPADPEREKLTCIPMFRTLDRFPDRAKRTSQHHHVKWLMSGAEQIPGETGAKRERNERTAGSNCTIR